MNVITLSVFSLTSVIALMLVKKYNSPLGFIVEIAVIVMVALSAIPDVSDLVSSIKSVSENAGISNEIFKTMLKAFGILAVGGVVSDICRDNSENALAGVVEMVVKILAFICALPTFTAVLLTALTLLEK